MFLIIRPWNKDGCFFVLVTYETQQNSKFKCLFKGLTMALVQGGYVRRISENKIRSTALAGLRLIIPSFICVGLAKGPVLLYLGLFLFAVCKCLRKFQFTLNCNYLQQQQWYIHV